MLKKYINKIPLLLGGVLLAVVSHQAVADDVCGNITGPTATKWGSIEFTSLDPDMPVGDKGAYTDFYIQYLPAQSYKGDIQVNIKSNGTDISKCGWTLSGSKYVAGLPSGKLYGNSSFTYSVPVNKKLKIDPQPDVFHTVTLTFDNGKTVDFKIEQAPLDPKPTVPNGCENGKTNRGGLCYEECKSGYSSDGTSRCYQNCPDGMSATTTSCNKGTYTRAAGTVPPLKCKGLKCKSECPGSKHKEDGLCYQDAKDGYDCKALTCWQKCPDGMKDFGVGCTKNSYSVGTGVVTSCSSDKFRYGELCYRRSYKGNYAASHVNG